MTPHPTPWTALVLAGSRRGATDPVAQAAGVAHKSLVPIGGRPMLLRVLDTLKATPSVGRLVVAMEGPALLEALPELAARVDRREIEVRPTAGSPAATVSDIAPLLDDPWPLLVTTSDHALLDVAMVETFLAGVPADADVGAALCSGDTIAAAYPDSRRSYVRLGRERYSGCNLFALRSLVALRATEFWVRMEAHRKRPWRYAAEIGIGPLVEYLTGRLTLERTASRLGAMMGVKLVPVLMPMAEAAIDVDTPDDLRQVETIAARLSA